MKTLFVIALICLCRFQTCAQFDTNLTSQIASWRKGDPPPARLLKFPDGKIDMIPECGLALIGNRLSDYVSRIQDTNLLAALIFDSRAEPETIRASASQLITLKGVGCVATMLAERRKSDPHAFAQSELAMLSQLLRAPYIAVQVARIAPEDMNPDRAENALKAMKTDLETGASWPDAYRKHAELHPDLRDRAKDPRSVRTLISYLYDGTVSPNGFDITAYCIAESLREEHLRELFRAKRGVHIFKAVDGVYLYYIKSFYDDAG